MVRGWNVNVEMNGGLILETGDIITRPLVLVMMVLSIVQSTVIVISVSTV